MSTEKQAQWLASPLGQYLKEQEQALFDEAVHDIFGFNAMQFGMLAMPLLRHCRIPYQFGADVAGGLMQCESHQLPLQAGSLDLLLLPHTLDFSEHPHQTLREAARVLVPEGHIIMTGFNPVSPWGIRRLASNNDDYPWDANFLSLMRVKDWLALLDFEVIEARMACHMPPFRNSSGHGRLGSVERLGARLWPLMGGVYFVLAKKRVIGMRLIKPVWGKSKLKAGLLPTPTQRTDVQNKHE
ncbi:class I SAM-dependent methyltransferase [Methylobacillus arboreus]|uniref:class I SAM-dependent methyltransferase n=1 Tax=Methylobacillus arboreus TaxID=755170 RepID=UPI001E464C44|nr:methyltransferase domain-containing protein [Methylobacillus arboreus]MCB5189741.1 class I SAM-dependent methyltransferase [Methylobacillus arboreus]